jgi:hypothetical protein
MRLFGYELEGFAKALVILVAVFLVASGLCGLQWAVSTGSQSSTMLIPLGIVALIVILFSGAGIVVVLIAWVIKALFNRSSD